MMNQKGHLVLRSYKTPFDVLPLKVGDILEITSGLNKGTWTILKIGKTALDLDKSLNHTQLKKELLTLLYHIL